MRLKEIILLFIFLCFSINTIFAQADKPELLIGTKVAEPFVIKNNNGEWTGISFELWERIAEQLNLNYSIKSYDLEGLTKAVANKEIDIAVSPLTITPEREKLFDFTHSYFTTGLSIAVSNIKNENLLRVAKNIFSVQFFKVVLLIFVVLFIVGLVVWLFERKKNKDQFGDGVTKGLGSSFWWAAVTITTVGYGDKAPRTAGGRIVAIIWMFAGLILISGFTAAIASALTIDQLDVGVESLSDLYGVRVGTVKSSSSEEYLIQNGIEFITVEDIKVGIELIKQNKIDAFVYDAPIIKYYVKSQNISNEVKVLPIILDPINYAFALPTGSRLKEKINQLLLKEIDNVSWKTVLNSYLGQQQ